MDQSITDNKQVFFRGQRVSMLTKHVREETFFRGERIEAIVCYNFNEGVDKGYVKNYNKMDELNNHYCLLLLKNDGTINDLCMWFQARYMELVCDNREKGEKIIQEYENQIKPKSSSGHS